MYPGLHPPLIARELWDQVQRLLDVNRGADRRKAKAKLPSPFAGLVFDSAGERLSPTHTGKNGLRYRYYVSSSSVRGRPRDDETSRRWRIPAVELEQIIIAALRLFLADESSLSQRIGLQRLTPTEAKAALSAAGTLGAALKVDDPAALRAQVHQMVYRIEVAETALTITIDISALRQAIGRPDSITGSDHHEISIPVRITKRGVEQKLIVGAEVATPAIPDDALLTALARAYQWVDEIKSGRVRDITAIAERERLPSSYVRSHLPLAFLAPSIVTAVLDGRQPGDLSLKQLMYRTDLPIEWAAQRQTLGFER